MALKFAEVPRRSNLTNRLYAIAVVGLIVSCLPLVMAGSVATYLGAVAWFVSIVSFVLAFSIWIVPKIRAVWRYPIRRRALIAVHVTILFAALPMARFFTAEAVGLPPQDFDLTVAIVALELYPALWILTFALGTLGLSIALLSVSMFLPVLSSIPPSISGQWAEVGKQAQRVSLRAWLHAMGATLVAVGSAMLWDWHAEFLLSHPNIIRRVAYVTDYQPARNYPGVDRAARLRLHENGVVSYAVPKGWDVEIIVGKVDL